MIKAKSMFSQVLQQIKSLEIVNNFTSFDLDIYFNPMCSQISQLNENSIQQLNSSVSNQDDSLDLDISQLNNTQNSLKATMNLRSQVQKLQSDKNHLQKIVDDQTITLQKQQNIIGKCKIEIDALKTQNQLINQLNQQYLSQIDKK
ncbi:Hypothetical_protein [Hexamita inflata]|uniref:Hypothetical_protein n=1 Tax=Hexamita inflata TaxID=28002 RepID=A0AA86TZV8_9EUKA|nr:Hypothetical protein HINF_LOCUS23985 [Hexamita inflata]